MKFETPNIRDVRISLWSIIGWPMIGTIQSADYQPIPIIGSWPIRSNTNNSSEEI